MIKFNIPYTSSGQTDAFNELVYNKKYAGGGLFNDKIKQILKEKYGFSDVYLTTSCTAAIQLCSMAIEINEGDEIIIPSYTFSSTPTPFLISGFKIVFADCSEKYPNVSLQNIRDKITKNTKAVMIVHYGGYNNEITQIQKFCSDNNILLIEDAAQAIHSFHYDKPLGSFGDFSVFSFHETKNINCGEGGMLVVNNKKYIDKIEKIYQCGTNRTDFLDGKIKNYEWVARGLSFMLSEINCSFLYTQLTDIELVTENRKTLWETYYRELSVLVKSNAIVIPEIEKELFNFHTFFICLNNKQTLQNLISFMKENNVQCATHYYPLHESIYAKEHFYNKQSLVNTEYYGDCLLRLPLHFYLNEKDVINISTLIKSFFENTP